MLSSNRNPLQKLFDNANKAKDTATAMDANKEAEPKNAGGNKRISVERIYQKKTQLEHILLRPDTYIGSVESATQQMWVYDGEEVGMVKRDITYVPGLYKIFDEILVNAADNKQRDKNMDTIKIDIDPENNIISVFNNGKGIPVVIHQTEKVYVPALIFGQLLTSSNYDDDEKKVTGGRNGFGAKLCNIFSTKFTVETSCKDDKKHFKQTWTNNMTKTSEAKIKPFTGEDFTKITFSPDLTKFKMDNLDKDIVALMHRRAYDVAGSSRGVKVFLNGKKLPIKNFKDYVDQYVKGKMDDMGNPYKIVYDNTSSARWEVAVTMSDMGFQQISFVNSIATTKGGRHVDYIVDQITAKLQDIVKKKNKGGMAIKPFQIKNHLWVFVNCLIENPTFDSQTKENMTLMVKSFGSKCVLNDKVITLITKCGVMDSILSWVKYKAETMMNKKCHATKHAKLKGILKLEDANNAGTKNSSRCTLIVTEGDSAKTLAVSGLAVVGRDDYGVFPLRGKMLNVREASHKQILENAEINHLIRILGLQYKKQYKSREDLMTLRYGKLMIMTDQDQDGSHIKGLLINFIHTNWPDLLRLSFLEEFITPIVKVTKGKQEKISFYSLPEFEEWKKKTEKWHTWKVKYYKGLGTSTTDEAKEYFNDMERHRILFEHKSVDDDKAITMAFSKKMVEARKEWLSVGMEDRKRRRELGLSEQYLYGKGTTAVSYQDFINKELILFSNLDNERSIPSLVDGMKPGQRKVLFTCFKRNDKHEVKVAQLAGSVAEHSAYHHGEQSLMSTIINLAQNFVGSNNINLLMPNGMFGTRLQGGKDAASPRYIFTMLSSLARHIFNVKDFPLLAYHNEDNQKIEPEWYIPVIPMILVNGADGIGTGWMTKVPNYDPREIVKNLKRMIHGQEPIPMNPWFKNFRGTVAALDVQRFAVSGEISVLDERTLEITELPVRVWTQSYKEGVLEPMLHGTDKIPSVITDYKEYNSDTTVRFVVSMSEEKLAEGERQGLHKMFKLQNSMTTSSMVLFDRNGVLKKYNNPEEILQEFYEVRIEFYHKRKAYLVGMLEAKCKKINNMTRFILEKISGEVVFENKKRKVIIEELFKKGYDSDPVKEWKKKMAADTNGEVSGDEEDGESEEDDHDYDYLMKMPGWNYTLERKNQLLAERDETQKELNELKKKSPSDLWEDDLDMFMVDLDLVEEKERQDAGEVMAGKPVKAARGKKGKNASAAKFTLPSTDGRRVEPLIDPELKKKAEKAADVAVKRANKKKDTSIASSLSNNTKSDSFKDDASEPEILSLAERIGLEPSNSKANDKALPTKKRALKQSTIKFPKASPKKNSSPKKKNKKNPWSDAEEISSEGNSDMDVSPAAVAPRERGSRRAAAGKAVYKIDSDSDEEMVANRAVMSSDEEDEPAAPKPAAKKPAAKATKPVTIEVDSESDVPKDKVAGDNNFDSDSDSMEAGKKKAPSKALQSSLFDSLMEGPKSSDGGDADANNSSNNIANSSEDKSEDLTSSKEEPKVAPAPAAAAAPVPAVRTKKPVSKPKRRKSSDEDSEEDLAPKKKRPVPASKKAKSSDESDEDVVPKKKKVVPSSRKSESSDTEDGYLPKPKKATAGSRKPAIKKKVVKVDSDDEEVTSKKSKKKQDLSDDDDMEDFAPRNPRARAARAKAPVKYNFGEDSEED